jgi:predicted dehydrogenase
MEWAVMTRIAVIGCGYWGSKHVRVFNELPNVELAMVADPSEARRAHIQGGYPNVPTTADYQEVLRRDDIDGVVIATPVTTHYRLAREALLAGKDVLVEKPLTDSAAQARELCLLADRLGRVLMVGHTFLYHPAIEYMRDQIASGAVGKIFYVDAARLNLGLFQRDTNVIWDLAPHDLAIQLYILGCEPESIRARGVSHVGARGQLDVAFLDLMFADEMIGNIRVSWLDPCKVRRVTVVGSKKMIVFNDVAGEEKVRIYDKGVTLPHETDSFSDFHLSYRHGDVMIPYIAGGEPLAIEGAHFVECIAERKTPRSDGWSGYQVVQLLEAAHNSLAMDGASVPCTVLEELQPADGRNLPGTGELRLVPLRAEASDVYLSEAALD